MKHLLAVLFVALGMPAFSQTTINWKPNYHWPLIDTVIEKGLPESALQLVDSIHQQAMVQKNELLQLKSSLYHIELKRSEDLNQDLYSILYLENELPNYHFPIRNLVQLKITQLYIKYTDNYSFEISKNSSNAFNKSAIESWPIEEFNTTILQNIQAIADPALKNSAISNYTEIIKKDETSVSNLYDFVAHELVQSIQNNRALLFWNMAHFNLKSDLMCSSQDFVKIKLPNSTNKNQDSLNEIIPLGVVLQLYQHLISNHLSDSSTELLIALDLERLAFVHENFTGDNEDNKYRLEIQKLLQNHSQENSSTRIALELGSLLYNWSDNYNSSKATEAIAYYRMQALKTLEIYAQRFPKSTYAKDCNQLITHIKEVQFNVAIESVNIPNQPIKAKLVFANLKQLYGKVFKLPNSSLNEETSGMSDSVIRSYCLKNAVTSFDIKLPEIEDYYSHETEIALPSLAVGKYLICFSDSAITTTTRIHFASVQTITSSLSSLNVTLSEEEQWFIVKNRWTGLPIEKVLFKLVGKKSTEYGADYDSLIIQKTSSKKGMVSVTKKELKGYSLLDLQIQWIANSDTFYLDMSNPYSNEITAVKDLNYDPLQIKLFTDRAMYRPGQKIFFKGIALDCNSMKLVPNKTITIQLKSAYPSVSIDSIKVTTNEMGSLIGTFLIPKDILTGNYQISYDDLSNATISIEAYKRPTFEIKFKPQQQDISLGDSTKILGLVSSFNGSNFDGVTIHYTIEKSENNYSAFNYSRMPAPTYSLTNNIVEGTALIQPKNEFTIPLLTKGFPNTTFVNFAYTEIHYTITVTFINNSGETQEGTYEFNVASQPNHLEINIPNTVIQLKDTLRYRIETINLLNQAVVSKGTISLVELERPNTFYKERSWGFSVNNEPDIYLYSAIEHQALFPYDQYKNELALDKLKAKKTIFSNVYSTPKDAVFQLPLNLKSGCYRIQLIGFDTHGKALNYSQEFYYVNTINKKDTLPMLFNSYLKCDSILPGAKINCFYKSAVPNMEVDAFIYLNSKIISHQQLHSTSKDQNLQFKTATNAVGTYTIEFRYLLHNRSYSETKSISIINHAATPLQLIVEKYNQTMQPGQTTTWKLSIPNLATHGKEAEVLASMYDATLDALSSSHQPNQDWDYVKLLNTNCNKPIAYSMINENSLETNDCQLSFSTIYYYPKNLKLDIGNWIAINDNYLTRLTGVKTFGTYTLNANFTEPRYRSEDNRQLTDSTVSPNESSIKSYTPTTNSAIRKNFQETAFFYPQLQTTSDKGVSFTFTLPESITKWRFRAVAHTKDLSYAYVAKTIDARKKLMTVTHLPRTLTALEKLVVTSSITNQTDQNSNPIVGIEITDAITHQPIDAVAAKVTLGSYVSSLYLPKNSSSISIFPNTTQSISWEIRIPENTSGLVNIKVLATDGTESDGEEITLPVLPTKVLLSKTTSIYTKLGTVNSYTLEELSNLTSDAIQPHRLTISINPNTLWNVILAMPYLLEEKQFNAEQCFARLYADLTCLQLVRKNAAFNAIINEWKQLPTDSVSVGNLEKEADLKSLVLQTTPWMVDAANEKNQRQRIASLCDSSNLLLAIEQTINQLNNFQNSNGSFSWYKGFQGDANLSQYLIGSAYELMSDNNFNPYLNDLLSKSFNYLNQLVLQKMKDKNFQLLSNEVDFIDAVGQYEKVYNENHLTLDSSLILTKNKLIKKGILNWQTLPYKQQAIWASTLWQNNQQAKGLSILNSIKEKAIKSNKIGIYWKSNNSFWVSPLEEAATILQIYQLTNQDTMMINGISKWIIQSKESNHWSNTKSTVFAIRALLNKNNANLSLRPSIDLQLGANEAFPAIFKNSVTPNAFQVSYFDKAIQSNMMPLEINAAKTKQKDFDATSIITGSIDYQYWQDLKSIPVAKCNACPMQISKQLTFQNLAGKYTLVKDSDRVEVGKELTIQLHFTVDRAMDYIHLQDKIATPFEMIDQTSHIEYGTNFMYYKSTADNAANFFIDHLEKGNYQISYKVRVAHRGWFNTGIAKLQCFYAPLFISNTDNNMIEVR